jgi:hypothetical protein
MTIEDGGAAFPTNSPYNSRAGMSLRDWFAGQALAGFCSQCDDTGMWSWLPQDAVNEAMKIADAMIAARKDTPA